jgi:hypothetical protein
VVFVDSSGLVSEFLALYSLPDSVLIGTGNTYSGLRQGPYFTRQFYPDGRIVVANHFLTNFNAFQKQLSILSIFTSSAIRDTCTMGKGAMKLGNAWGQKVRDTLNQIQWSWSNGQTGLNASR